MSKICTDLIANSSSPLLLLFRVLVREKELYADCDIVIKRHLWRDNQSLFGDEVSPFLSQYIKEKEQVLYSHENNPGFFTV